MKAIYRKGRYIYTDTGWYVYMRAGDERHKMHCGFRLIEYHMEDGQPIAGPFRTKRSMISWLQSFIAFHGRPRRLPKNYIPDDLVVSDRNCVFV
jgi:hypothetical protein